MKTASRWSAIVVAIFFSAAISVAAVAQTQPQLTITQISSDPFTDNDAQHATEVEPDAFAYGNTIVSAFQVGRIYDGGGSDIGFSTSTDGGKTWTSGYLPGLTVNYKNGTFTAASDAAVAYDAAHGVWLICTLPLGNNDVVAVSPSPDGLTWGKPVLVTNINADKNWIACDNTSTSPYLRALLRGVGQSRQRRLGLHEHLH